MYIYTYTYTQQHGVFTDVLFSFRSGREYPNLIMDCCQLEEGVTGMKMEDVAGNDPENGSPDADRGGKFRPIITSCYHQCTTIVQFV